MRSRSSRLWLAIAAYAMLAVAAALTLDVSTDLNRKIRYLVFIVLAAFAVLTWVHGRQRDE